MTENDGKIWFGAGIDNSGLAADARRTNEIIKGIGTNTEKEGQKMDNTFKMVAASVAAFFTIQQASQYALQIAKVRGEFQQLEVAFKTMLGSKAMADQLMTQIVKTAATTPFNLQEVAGGAKSLLAYGTEAEDVNETLIRLGDIAAGLSIPFNDMVYLFGTTMTQGRLYSQDLNQFLGRGIPLADELAKQFGVQKSAIKEMVTEGKIGFPEVKKAIWDMTEAGSKFGGLMEAQSKTITGQISNLEDSISQMYNEIGKENEGLINDVIASAGWMVQNYEKVGKTIAELVVVYGAYKAALITITALQTVHAANTIVMAAGKSALTIAELAHYSALVLVEKAQKLLNATMLKNPYVLAAAAVAGLAYGLYKLTTRQTESEKAQSKLNETTNDLTVEVNKENIEIETLFSRLKHAKEGTEEWKKAKEAIITRYGTYLNGLDAETTSLQNQAAAYEAIKQGALNAAKAKALDRATSDAATDLADKQASLKTDLKKVLTDKYGEGSKQAIGYFEQLSKLIDSGKGSDVLDKNFRKSFYDYGWGSNKLAKILDDAKEAKTIYSDVLKTAEELYRTPTATSTGGTTEPKEGDTKTIGGVEHIYKGGKWEPQGTNPKDEKGKTPAQIAAEKAAAIRDQALKDARLKEDLDIQIREEQISRMNDGAEKTLAALKLNHEKEMLQLKRQREDLLEAQRDIAENKWLEKNTKGAFNRNSITGYDQSGSLYNVLSNQKELSHLKELVDLMFSTTKGSKIVDPDAKMNVKIDFSVERKNYLETFSKVKSLSELIQFLHNNPEALGALADSVWKISEAAGALGEALELADGALGDIGKTISGLSGSVDSFLNIVEAEDWTDVVSNGLKGVSSLLGMVLNQINENKEYQEQWNEKLREAAQQAALTRIELAGAYDENIFGVGNPYQGAISGAYEYAQAMQELNAQIAGLNSGQVVTGSKQVVDWKNVGIGAGSGATTGAAIGTAIGGWAFGAGTVIGAAIGAVVGGVAGLLATETVDVLESLSVKYGELFDPKTYELNQQILDDYSKLDDDTKKIVDNWDEIVKKTKEAEEKIRTTLTDLAGELGNQLSDSLVEAFTGGNINSAIDSFHGKVTTVIEDIISRMIFNQMFKGIFETLETGMIDSFTGANGDGSIVDDIVSFSENYATALQNYNQAMIDAQEAMTAQGFDIFKTSRTANAGGIQSMNQETASELNGRFTAMQGLFYQFNEQMKSVVEIAAKGLLILGSIDRNTGRLENIENSISQVKSGIDDINTKGIKVRV